jgi:hypothetical protein
MARRAAAPAASTVGRWAWGVNLGRRALRNDSQPSRPIPVRQHRERSMPSRCRSASGCRSTSSRRRICPRTRALSPVHSSGFGLVFRRNVRADPWHLDWPVFLRKGCLSQIGRVFALNARTGDGRRRPQRRFPPGKRLKVVPGGEILPSDGEKILRFGWAR